MYPAALQTDHRPAARVPCTNASQGYDTPSCDGARSRLEGAALRLGKRLGGRPPPRRRAPRVAGALLPARLRALAPVRALPVYGGGGAVRPAHQRTEEAAAALDQKQRQVLHSGLRGSLRRCGEQQGKRRGGHGGRRRRRHAATAKPSFLCLYGSTPCREPTAPGHRGRQRAAAASRGGGGSTGSGGRSSDGGRPSTEGALRQVGGGSEPGGHDARRRDAGARGASGARGQGVDRAQKGSRCSASLVLATVAWWDATADT